MPRYAFKVTGTFYIHTDQPLTEEDLVVYQDILNDEVSYTVECMDHEPVWSEKAATEVDIDKNAAHLEFTYQPTALVNFTANSPQRVEVSVGQHVYRGLTEYVILHIDPAAELATVRKVGSTDFTRNVPLSTLTLY